MISQGGNDPDACAEAPFSSEVSVTLPALFPNVCVREGDGELSASGQLRITAEQIEWVADRDDSLCINVPHLDVVLHAISRAEDNCPPCIYAQYGDSATELRIVPNDEHKLESIFQTMCHCAAAVGDVPEQGDPHDDAGDLYWQENGHGDRAKEIAERLDNMLVVDTQALGANGSDNDDDGDKDH